MVLKRIKEALGIGRKREGPQCVACESYDVTTIAPDTYHCDECGYEGGEGYAAYQRQKKLVSLEGIPPAELRSRAREDLIEAKGLLRYGIEDLEEAIQAPTSRQRDGLILKDVYGEEMRIEYNRALGRLLEARNLIDDAIAKMKQAGVSVAVDTMFEEEHSLLNIDIDRYFDSEKRIELIHFGGDLRGLVSSDEHRRLLEKSLSAANVMLSLVKKFLRVELGKGDVT